MRIISSFIDYYDTISKQYPGDQKRVFVRESEEVFCDRKYGTNYGYTNHSSGMIHIYSSYLIFCNIVIPFIEIYNTDSRNFYYDSETLFRKNPELLDFKPPRYKRVRMMVNTDELKNHFNSTFKHNTLKLHRGLSSAYILFSPTNNYRREKITIYPILKDIDLFRRMDPITCWQKIEQFLTNEMVPPDEIKMKISDQLKAETHGFDKYSFRKDKVE